MSTFELTAVQPAMVIGLGGSGVNVLSEFKNLTKFLPNVPPLLAIDRSWFHGEAGHYGFSSREALFLGDRSFVGHSDATWLGSVLEVLKRRLRIRLLEAAPEAKRYAAIGRTFKIIIVSSIAGHTGSLLLPTVTSEIRTLFGTTQVIISGWILGADLFHQLHPMFQEWTAAVAAAYPFRREGLDELVSFDISVIAPIGTSDIDVYKFIAQELIRELPGINRADELYSLRPEDSHVAVIQLQDINAELVRSLKSNPRLLINLEPRCFEELVAFIWKARGYSVTLTPQTRDGGKDIYAAQHSEFGNLLYVIECKRYAPDRPVGVEIVRSLYGVAQHERATKGVVATTSTFTKDAIEFQSKVPYQLSLHDYTDLVKWLQAFERVKES